MQFNDNLLVGKAYTGLLNLKPGDEFEIKLGRKQIRLVRVGGADEEEWGAAAPIAPTWGSGIELIGLTPAGSARISP